MKLSTCFALVSMPLGTLLWPSQALPQTVADPTQPPVAGRQTPNWDAYYALGIRTAPAGRSYADPATGITVRKITRSTVPGPDAGADHDYAEGGPLISREWGNGRHTVLIPTVGGAWLGDYQRGMGVTNWRQFPTGIPYPYTDLTASFSNVAATPRILFYVSSGKLFRFNTATMRLEGEGGIPAGGVDIPGTAVGRFEWLQISRDDTWLVLQSCSDIGTCIRGKVWAFNRMTGQLLDRAFLDLNEPRLERGGRSGPSHFVRD